MDDDLPRRAFLTGGSAFGAVTIAGCTDVLDGDGTDGTDDNTQSPNGNGTDDESTSSDGIEGTSESENEPPEIVEFDAEATEYGTVLTVRLEGEDANGIEHAEISYGDQRLTESSDDTSVTVEGELTDIHEADLEETPGAVIFTLEDVEGQVTEEQERPHHGAPSVSVTTAATATPGELQIEIEADDDIGLHWVELELNGESIEEFEAVGTKETELDVTLDDDETTIGDTNDVTVAARNTFGDIQRSSQDQYVREFEPLQDQDVEVGAVYMPFFGNRSDWQQCAVGTPEVGPYYMDDEEALNRHGDLMAGHGISRLQFDFFEPEQTRPFLQTRSYTLLNEVPLEVMYVIGNSMRWRGDKSVGERLDDCLETIREDFFTQDNYAKRDGRPTVKFWDISWVTWEGEEASEDTRDYILNEFGGFEEFGNHLRSELTVDGNDPYLIGGFSNFGEIYYEEGSQSWMEEELNLVRSLDAVSNWIEPLPPEESSIEKDNDIVNSNYIGYEKLAEEEDLDFIPLAYPGYDDRDNNCWVDEQRYLPRGNEYFEDRLRIADEHRTIDRIDTASFNDWGEGHQIEPGEHRGEEYGTEFLEVVREFAQGDG